MTATPSVRGASQQAFAAAKAGADGLRALCRRRLSRSSTSETAALAALDAGADLLEIGLPYSDPLADGVTLQRASAAALGHGADLDGSLDLVERVAKRRPDKPVVVMGYANQFLGPRGERGSRAAAGRCRRGRCDRGRPDARRGRAA